MTKPRFFFITGHQRSRTAWFSNLTTRKHTHTHCGA
jgi:hypothetical protein